MKAMAAVAALLLPVLPPTADGGGDGINSGATATAPAVRVNPPPPMDVVVPRETGLGGAPFAPEGLSGCDEMSFYRQQWGLPEVFDRIGWRESNCRNEESVHTFCCWGYFQLYISLFLRDHRMIDKMAWCDVGSRYDIDSDTPLDKQRQACAAKALYDVEGMSPWST